MYKLLTKRSTALLALLAMLVLGSIGKANPTLPPGTWVNVSPTQLNMTSNPCTDLQFDAGNPATLYGVYANTGGGILKSTDGGSNWNPIGNLPSYLSLGRIRIDPKNPAHLYYIGSVWGNSLGFWVSQDTGNTWAIPAAFKVGAGTTWNYDVYNMAVDPLNFNHVIMDFHSSWANYGNDAGIVESKDGGVTFIAHPPISGMSLGQGIVFLHDPIHGLGDENTWLLGGGYGYALYRTTDAGATWSTVGTMQENHGGFDAHYSPATGFVYFGANNGIWRSTDNGVTWTNVFYALGNHYYSVIGDGNRLYSGQSFVGTDYNLPFIASNEGGGANEGTSWSNYSTQTLPEGPFRMVFDSTNRIVYAATWSGGARALRVIDPVTAVRNVEHTTSSAVARVSRNIVVKDGKVCIQRGVAEFYDGKGSRIKPFDGKTL